MSRKRRKDSEENPFEKGEHAVDMRQLAIDSLQSFFKNKKLHSGGEIPQYQLLSEYSILMLLRTQLDDRCLDFIHEECLPLIPVDPNYNEVSVPWTVYSLLCLLRELASHQLPKDYFAGLLMLYFKFCYGVKVLDPPLI